MATPSGVMQFKSKNEFAYNGSDGGPSPRSNKEETKGMKVIPMNYSEKE